MSEDNILSMGQATGDAFKESPEGALRNALKDIGKHGAFKEGKKLLILCLDQGEESDKYEVSFIQAGMKMSECVALCEMSKNIFLGALGYNIKC